MILLILEFEIKRWKYVKVVKKWLEWKTSNKFAYLVQYPVDPHENWIGHCCISVEYAANRPIPTIEYFWCFWFFETWRLSKWITNEWIVVYLSAIDQTSWWATFHFNGDHPFWLRALTTSFDFRMDGLKRRIYCATSKSFNELHNLLKKQRFVLKLKEAFSNGIYCIIDWLRDWWWLTVAFVGA